MGLRARANGTLPPVAVIPLKGLDHAKSRLGGVLSRAERAELALRLLAGVIGACQEAELSVCVISPDPQARAEAARLGADTLDDGGADLTGAVRLGLERHAHAEAVVAIAADLPFVTADDVRELLDLARPLAVAPAPDGTTNAVAARPPSALRPSYGPGSADRHGGLHVHLPRLAQDLDTPEDLASWRATLAV
jgi:2-phospho-L-lactate guanylyltransferase